MSVSYTIDGVVYNRSGTAGNPGGSIPTGGTAVPPTPTPTGNAQSNVPQGGSLGYTTSGGQQMNYIPGTGQYVPAGQTGAPPPTPPPPAQNTSGNIYGVQNSQNTGAALPGSTPTVPYEQASQNLNKGGLTGNALQDAQNALKAKYQGFVASKGGSAAPDTGADARSAISSYNQNQPPPPPTQADPVTEAIAGAITQYQNDVSSLNGYEGTVQSIASYQNQVSSQLGIPELQTQDMNIKTIMSGSEDDIRSEISSTGGTATESQVEAMAVTRNKVLVKQATNIENQLSIAQNSLQMSVSAFQGDQANALTSFKDKVSNDSNILSVYQSIQQNNASNLNRIVSNTGYSGLAKVLLASDPSGTSLTSAEGALGLPAGSLTNPTSLSALETYREQTIGQADTRLQETYGITPDQVNSLGGTDSGIQATDGGSFAQFPSMQAGLQAAQQLITSPSYSSLSVNDALLRWSGGGYGSEITSLPATAVIGDLNPNQLTKLVNDMSVAEGGRNAAGYRVNNPLDIKYVASAPAVGTTGNPGIDTTTPGYTSVVVPSTGGLTQAALDQAALQYSLTGTLPAGGRSNTGAGLQQSQAIKNRAAELNSGGNIAANKANLSALSTSLTAQTTYKNNIQQSLTKAESGFNQLMTAFSGSGIDPSQSTVANSSLNSVASKFTGGNLFAYQAGLAEISADYAQVFARNGITSVATQSKANDILNGNISFKDLQAVQQELQAQGKTAVDSAGNQISSIQNQINGIISPNSNTPSTNSGASNSSGNSVNFVHGNMVINSSSGEKTYIVGQTFSIGGLTLMLKADGTLVDTKGNTGIYTIDPDGNINKK